MATDVPFWRKSTGAQQRMASLVNYLESQSFIVRTFYLGQTGSERYTDRDQALISQYNLDVDQRSSDQPPDALAKKIAWFAEATLNQIKQLGSTPSHKPLDHSSENSAPSPPTLEDYRWPWAMTAFSESVSQFKPDSILIQYIKLSYLLDSLTPDQRNKIKTIVDTHDVLHLRAEQFRQRGLTHWIELSREQEAEQLRKFDSILAIQSKEAKIFRELAPESETIICGHGIETTSASVSPPSNAYPSSTQSTRLECANSKTIRIGYIASNNAANGMAIENFIEQSWNDLVATESIPSDSNPSDSNQTNFEFVIAGTVCKWLTDKQLTQATPNLTLLGRVDSLSTFYDQIDVVINPVEFGTGLKIKNCEALAFGKPLLTTPHGFEGMPPQSQRAVLICETLDQFRDQLCKIQSHPKQLVELRLAAEELSQTLFSSQQAYSTLKLLLER
ncbi:MAG: glycosyltransferase [Mariniblastus sp.]